MVTSYWRLEQYFDHHDPGPWLIVYWIGDYDKHKSTSFQSAKKVFDEEVAKGCTVRIVRVDCTVETESAVV